MADKINVEINRYNGTDYDQLLPGTSVSQVDGLQAALDAKQPTLTPGQNIAIDNNTIGTKAFPCNPNLLDNWYFGNPVNQRGQTSWENFDGYIIDRWRTERYGTVGMLITLDSGAITVANSNDNPNSYIGIRQLLEFGIANGTSIVASTLTESGLKVFQTELVSGVVRAKDFGNFTIYLYQEGTLWQVTLRVPQGKSETFYAIKLELGTEQTLAHQDANGNWVLNEIPAYGEQLMRCQRYFTRMKCGYGYDVMGSGFANADGSGRVIISLPTTMRTTPAITHTPNVSVISGGQLYAATVNSVRINSNPSNPILELSVPNLTNRSVFVLTPSGNNEYFDFSADL